MRIVPWRLARSVPLWLVLAAMFVFLLAPIAAIFSASLQREQNFYYTLWPRDVSLVWYLSIPAKYWRALGISLLVAAIAAGLTVGLGGLAALALVRGRLSGAATLNAFFRVPLQIPFVVTGVVFLQFYDRAADLGPDLLGSITGLVLAHLFVTLPYGVSAIAVILVRIGPRYEEAAQICGCSRSAAFFRVALPLLKPGVFAGFFYAFIVSFGDVPVAIFLTDENTTTLPVAIFQSLQFDFEPALLALSTVVIVLSVALILAVQKLAGLDMVVPSQRR
jgi:putative spermidine/putrescine transport system permease protein